MRRASLLLAVALLLFAPSWAGAIPVLNFYGTGSLGVDPLTGNQVFTGDISSLSATGAPQNNGTYTAAGGPLVQIFADLDWGTLSADPNGGTATLGYTSAGGTTFNLPYYFLQSGFFTTAPITVAANGDISGMGPDFKGDPAGDVGAISPFESFFGIGAVNDEYAFTFNAWINQAGIYQFDLSNTPTNLRQPEVVPDQPGTLLLLGSALAGLVGAYRRKTS